MTTKVKPSVLADTAVTAGTYGGSTQHSVFTVDAQGRLIYAGNATPSIATSQLTGTISATQVANNQTYGINISGNAATVTNGVVTSGSYSDPSWLTLSKSKVGLGNVDNTADANKSVSYAATAGSATTASNGGVTSVNGATGAVSLANIGFANSLGSSGSQTLPGGLKINWGQTSWATASDGVTKSVTFTTAFSSACYGAWAIPSAGDNTIRLSSFNTTGATFRLGGAGSIGSWTGTLYWIAIGS